MNAVDCINTQVFYLQNKKCKDQYLKLDLFPIINWPGSLPRHLIFINKGIQDFCEKNKDDLKSKFFVAFNIDKNWVKIYESYDDFKAEKSIAKCPIYFSYTPFIGIIP